VDGNKTFKVSLSNPSTPDNVFQGAVLGAIPNATVTIIDDDQPGTLQIAAPSYTIKKTGSAQFLTVTVSRTGGSAGGVTVAFQTNAGHARPGVDYNNTSGILTFGPGVMSQTFPVQILASGPAPPPVIPEDFEINISNPGGGAVLGSRTFVAGTITEPVAPTTMQFSGTTGCCVEVFPEYHTTETSHSVNVTVTRSGPTTGTSTVQLFTFDALAVAGVNYVAVNEVLNFFPGQTSKIVTIPLLDNETIQGTLEFGIVLTNTTGDVTNTPVPPSPAVRSSRRCPTTPTRTACPSRNT
jgi:hypothetical protein